ncbi:uncharacterized protein N7506_000971 [Penicillium brevicompactum]|uniref:uncharacterized protein n=1 Tax=Penicillium brevicompactum TaxID=5074 RepID=UPI00253FCAA1|nr:uncharacterized protein N7506_000971 [Penicillium brevicompactum]KAJ5347718.1 hypothetical protein N7506_000971 [Penicillium brevicompactum]
MNPHNVHTNQTTDPIPWSEIFARHEAVLHSHMEMLSMVKGQIAPGLDAFQTVSSMVNKTVQAMNQLKVARKQMMNKSTSTSSASSSSNPSHTDAEANTRKKRRRVSREKEPSRPEVDAGGEVQYPSRFRDPSAQPPLEQDEYMTSTSLGTEDISAEVQRRLKIREEQRRKRDTPKQDKRKRESLVSNESASPGPAARPRKKRARVDSESKRSGEVGDGDTSRKRVRRAP